MKLGRHPSLVRYLGLCTEGPDQLLLTELAPHGSLDQFLEAREDEVTMAHKLKMLEQICAGMVALSGAGMVHRDLATRNILVFAFDAHDPAATVVKITDFGLAVDRHYQTHATVQGEAVPFRWMSPEAESTLPRRGAVAPVNTSIVVKFKEGIPLSAFLDAPAWRRANLRGTLWKMCA